MSTVKSHIENFVTESVIISPDPDKLLSIEHRQDIVITIHYMRVSGWRITTVDNEGFSHDFTPAEFEAKFGDLPDIDHVDHMPAIQSKVPEYYAHRKKDNPNRKGSGVGFAK